MTLCECGCGLDAGTYTKTRRGHRAGEPRRFVRGHYARTQPIGAESYAWKTGKSLDAEGYVRTYAGVGRSHVLEHRVVMEQHLGRGLSPNEVVHHKNGDKTNNSIENLELFHTHAEHMEHHHAALA